MVHDRGHFICPALTLHIELAFRRFLGRAVPAKIISHKPEFLSQLASKLAFPGKLALGKSVDEQDFPALWVPASTNMNLQTVGGLYE